MGLFDWFAKLVNPSYDKSRQDIYHGYKGDKTHGHMVLKDVDGDHELEVVYDRDTDGTVHYDSGE